MFLFDRLLALNTPIDYTHKIAKTNLVQQAMIQSCDEVILKLLIKGANPWFANSYCPKLIYGRIEDYKIFEWWYCHHHGHSGCTTDYTNFRIWKNYVLYGMNILVLISAKYVERLSTRSTIKKLPNEILRRLFISLSFK